MHNICFLSKTLDHMSLSDILDPRSLTFIQFIQCVCVCVTNGLPAKVWKVPPCLDELGIWCQGALMPPCNALPSIWIQQNRKPAASRCVFSFLPASELSEGQRAAAVIIYVWVCLAQTVEIQISSTFILGNVKLLVRARAKFQLIVWCCQTVVCQTVDHAKNT